MGLVFVVMLVMLLRLDAGALEPLGDIVRLSRPLGQLESTVAVAAQLVHVGVQRVQHFEHGQVTRIGRLEKGSHALFIGVLDCGAVLQQQLG
jgi:hypothetical protein